MIRGEVPRAPLRSELRPTGRYVAFAVVIACSALALAATTSCQRRQTPGAPAVAAPGPGPAPGGGRAEPSFTHPMLAAATTDVVHEDCSRRALATVLERVRALRRLGPGHPGDRGARRPGGRPKAGCPSAGAGEADRLLRGELLSRIGACTGRDGPFDVHWAMLNSAVLSLGICGDCGQARDERMARCQRAQDILGRVGDATRLGDP